MFKKITATGNDVSSIVSYLFTEVAGIYPITPSSTMSEVIDQYSIDGKKNMFNDSVRVVEMQSEAGAAGFVHGSLQSGVLTGTFTSSQGLLLMLPNMYKIAGEMLPCVFQVSARSLSTHALSIFGDHQDIYAARMTGFAMLSSTSVLDSYYMSAVAHLSTLKASIPFMHFSDGFRTSHEIQKINVLKEEELISLVDKQAINTFRKRGLNPLRPITRGTAQNDDIYFQGMEVRNKYYDAIPAIVNGYMEKINKLTGLDYKPFNYYGDLDATHVIVAMGSVCSTIMETIDDLKTRGYKVGLVTVRLYRPFSVDYLKAVLPPSVENIAVLDRTKEAGSIGEPLYLDVKSVLSIPVYGGRYGLSSKNTTPAQIKSVYDMLINNPVNNFTIGIKDDLTKLSLKVDNNYKIVSGNEFLIYGYGSDGMVSASQSLMRIYGDNTDYNVQGYFQYDSKKSGGVTVSHLRVDEEEIRSSYYVETPSVVVVTKDSYLQDFNPVENLLDNGVFIVNTVLSKDEFISSLPNCVSSILISRNIDTYIIDANSIAVNNGISGKISMIMESILIKKLNIISYEKGIRYLKDEIRSMFLSKGEEVVNANFKAIDESVSKLLFISSSELTLKSDECIIAYDTISKINKREGDSLPVSAMIPFMDGSFPAGSTDTEKRSISDFIPEWMKDNCIQCTTCSFTCPHGVIRPYLLSEEEYNNSPNYVKDKCIPAMGQEGYFFSIGVSQEDCTGCGLCIKNCPGRAGEKALKFSSVQTAKDIRAQDRFDHLNENIKDKKIYNQNLIKGTQFATPKFRFSGACAGCGETPYIKLLTQILGDGLIIANATGCSSIYGGSAPSTPYSIPWASSLFEDNAEFAYGMLVADKVMKGRLAKIMKDNMDEDPELYNEWLANTDNFGVTKRVYDSLNGNHNSEIIEIKDFIIKKSVWAIGGDGWAYDIGYSGIDHILASGDDVNILVLDTEVYSNTGGQSSKSSKKGSVSAFTAGGKKVNSKDLARIAMIYPDVYVAQISLGANGMQSIKAINEAVNHKGPSIIIAYSPCISHGIKGGMINSTEQMKLATGCGYFPIFRRDPVNGFTLDSQADFEKYEEFLMSQGRYNKLKDVNNEEANSLLKMQKDNAMMRYKFLEKLVEDK